MTQTVNTLFTNHCKDNVISKQQLNKLLLLLERGEVKYWHSSNFLLSAIRCQSAYRLAVNWKSLPSTFRMLLRCSTSFPDHIIFLFSLFSFSVGNSPIDLNIIHVIIIVIIMIIRIITTNLQMISNHLFYELFIVHLNGALFYLWSASNIQHPALRQLFIFAIFISSF